MLVFSLILFALAAVLGIIVALAILRRQTTSKAVVAAHGVAGAAGLVVLLIYALQQPQTLLSIAVGLLVVAAVGGFVLLANDLRGRPGPVPLVAIHAVAAVVAVVLVAVVFLG